MLFDMRPIFGALICCALIFTVQSSALHAQATDGQQGDIPVTFANLDLIDKPISGVAISADERWVAIDQTNHITVVDADHVEQRFDLGPGFLPVWSPVDSRLAFYSSRSGSLQLWVWSPGKGAPRQLTSFEKGIDPEPTARISGNINDAYRFDWSPDARRIILTSRLPRKALTRAPALAEAQTAGEDTPLVLTKSTPDNWTLSGIFARPIGGSVVAESKDGKSLTLRPVDTTTSLYNQLFLVDASTGVARLLTDTSKTYFNPTFSPDGNSIAAARVDSSAIGFDTLRSDLVMIDVKSSRELLISTVGGIKYRPRWSRDGRYLAFLAIDGLFGWPKISILDSMKSDTHVLNGIDRFIFRFDWTPNQRELVVSFKDGPVQRLSYLNISSNSSRNISWHDGQHPVSVGEFNVSRAGGVVWGQVDPINLNTVQLVQARSPKVRTVLQPDQATKRLALGKVEILTWRNSDGAAKQGSVLYPPGYRPGKAYPVIVDVYPVQGAGGWGNKLAGNQAWAAAGYVVFRPSPRSPHTWMNPWTTEQAALDSRGLNGWKLGMDDILSGTDELVRRGIADPKRMCLFGHSNGGAVVDYVVTKTNRFACAVAVAASMPDWVQMLYPNHINLNRQMTDLDTDENIDTFIELSAVYRTSKVTTPILLAAGDNDGTVISAIEMYNGLKSYGKEVTFLRYPFEGHAFEGKAMADFWNREMSFFEKYLDPGR